MPTLFFSFISVMLLKPTPGSLAMSSLSLPFEISQDSNTMPFSDMYSTPRLLGNLSVSSGTTSVSPSMPLDSSLLSPANIADSHNGACWAQGGTITHDPNAYIQLTRCNQQVECELIKEREEHFYLK